MCEMGYKSPRISHVLAGLILSPDSFTEDLYGIGYTVKILLFPNLSLLAGLEVVLGTQRRDTNLDTSTITTGTASLLQLHKIAPIVVWEASVRMVEQWAVFLVVILGLPDEHQAVYELNMVINAAEKLNARIQDQASCHKEIPAASVQFIKNEFNESC